VSSKEDIYLATVQRSFVLPLDVLDNNPSSAHNHYIQHPTSNTYHLLVTTTTERHHAFHLNPIDIPTFRILGFRFFFPSQFRLTLINTSSSRIQPPARAAELRYRPLPDVESAVLYGGYAYQQQQCVYIAFGLEYRREY
jgi:hypothetical protein